MLLHIVGHFMKLSEYVYLVGSGEVGLSSSLDCHVYLIGDKSGLVMVDAGAGVDSRVLMVNVEKEGFSPRNVEQLVITHCHSDHACGGAEIKAATGCEVLASAEDAPYIEHGSDNELGLGVCKKAKWYPDDYEYKHCKIDRTLKTDAVLTLSTCKIRTMVLKGHSYGVVCLVADFGSTRRAFFSSDTVFIGGTIGLGNWPGSGLDAYRATIGKVAGLNVGELYPGHGLWTLRDGQKHLDKAVDNLSYGWVPPIGSHNHPVY